MSNEQALDLYHRGKFTRHQFLDVVAGNEKTDQERAFIKDCLAARMDRHYYASVLKMTGAVLIYGDFGRSDILWYWNGGNYERITNMNTVLYRQDGKVISADWHRKK